VSTNNDKFRSILREFCRNAISSFYNRLAHYQTAERHQFEHLLQCLVLLKQKLFAARTGDPTNRDATPMFGVKLETHRKSDRISSKRYILDKTNIS